MTNPANATDTQLNGLSFEAALKELEGVIQKMESGQAPLEEAIQLYERGIQLQKHCAGKLKDAELKVDMILKNEDGSLKTVPFEE